MRRVAGAIDTHTHIQFKQFDADRDDVLRGCWDAGLEALVVVGTDADSSLKALAVAEGDDRLFATAGFHPHDASSFDAEAEALIDQLAADGRVVAIGEIGLDFYRNLSPREAQERAFTNQLAIAARHDLPVVVHTRDSIDRAYEILSEWAREPSADGRPRGVMHCFSGSVAQAEAFAGLGFLISIPATITYPNSQRLRDVAAALPLNVLVLETDSPYLPPQSRRGQRNDPSQVLSAAAEVAKVRGQSQDEIVTATTNNARRLFRIDESNGRR